MHLYNEQQTLDHEKQIYIQLFINISYLAFDVILISNIITIAFSVSILLTFSLTLCWNMIIV